MGGKRTQTVFKYFKGVEGYDFSGFTTKYCRFLVKKLFQFAFEPEEIQTVADAKLGIDKVLCHYMPEDHNHTECRERGYDWCPVVKAQDKKPSQSPVKSPPKKKRKKNKKKKKSKKHKKKQIKPKGLGRLVPSGMRDLFVSWLYSDLFSDEFILLMLKPGCTSLNESLNHLCSRCDAMERSLPTHHHRIAAVWDRNV
eukprot:403815_1